MDSGGPPADLINARSPRRGGPDKRLGAVEDQVIKMYAIMSSTMNATQALMIPHSMPTRSS